MTDQSEPSITLTDQSEHSIAGAGQEIIGNRRVARALNEIQMQRKQNKPIKLYWSHSELPARLLFSPVNFVAL